MRWISAPSPGSAGPSTRIGCARPVRMSREHRSANFAAGHRRVGCDDPGWISTRRPARAPDFAMSAGASASRVLGNAAGRAFQRVRQSGRAQQAEIPPRLQLHLARLDADGEQPPQTAVREADPLPHAAQEQQRGGRGAFAGGHERQVETLPAQRVNPVQETRSAGDARTRRRDDDEVVHAPGQPRRLPADSGASAS